MYLSKVPRPMCALLVLLLTAMASLGQPSVANPELSPSSVSAGIGATVLVTASIPDNSVIPDSVVLNRVDNTGRILASAGRMYDDGTNGDAVAGDKRYSLRVQVLETAPGVFLYRVSAAFRGLVQRINSQTIPLTVVGSTATGVTITSPANQSYVALSPTIVRGTTADPNSTVSVNGVNAIRSGNNWQATIPLIEGMNTLTAVANNSNGSVSTASIGVSLDTTPPRVAIVSPSNGFSTTAASVSVSGNVNDLTVGTVNDIQATVSVNGAPAAVANRTFSASNIPLNVGVNNIQAVARDRSGNSSTLTIQVTRTVPVAGNQIQIVSGDGQTAAIGTRLAQPLIVRVVNGSGQPLPNTTVVFRVTENNGYLQGGSASSTVATDAQGRASTPFTVGTRAGAGNNRVEASATGANGLIAFTATSSSATAALISPDSGNNQFGVIGQNLPLPFVAVATDSGFNRLGNIPVTFRVLQGGGTFQNNQATFTTTTDSDGRALAVLRLGLSAGNDNNIVEANFSGNAGLAAAFTASARVPGDAASTRISGIVLNNQNQPLAGVTMRVFRVGLGSNNNAPQQVATPVVTDAQGQFNIQPAPVGVLKLMADGTTAQPFGGWPTLEYDMVTVAGQDNNVGMPIYLPRLDQTNRLCVSPTQGGTLTLAAVPGFALTVPANSATFPGGSRTGCITVTPVNPDKVPMVPGFGQQPRFVVTIQPVGTAFSPPARLQIPNVDGLLPRAKTEMYSFDHDLASFVAIGTGTVSDDGLVIASDPGVGVVKAGWHCGGNPNTTGSAGSCPQCQKCQGSQCVPAPGSCDDGKYCTTNDRCANGACTGDPRPDGFKTTTSYQLNQVQNLINALRKVLATTHLDSAVELPQITAQFSKSSQGKCCERTQSNQDVEEVAGTLGVTKGFGPFRPQFPPYTGNYTATFDFFGERSVGVAYGVEISGQIALQGQLKRTKDNCPQPPSTCWEGSITLNFGATGGLFGEVPNPAVTGCGPAQDRACSLLKVSGTLTTGIQGQSRVNCTQIVIGDTQWAGLTAEATFQLFENTAVDFSFQKQIELFGSQSIDTNLVIDLPQN